MKYFYRALLIFAFVIIVQSHDLSIQLEEQVDNYVKEGKSDKLKTVIEQIFEEKKKDLSENNAHCLSCKIVANAGISLRQSGADDKIMSGFLQNMCMFFTNYGVKTCRGIVDLSLDSWLYILDNKNVTSDRICSIKLQHMNCLDPSYEPWHINIPEGESKPLPHKAAGKAQIILQLSDVHYDPLYEPGSNGNCGESMCCEVDSGVPEDPSESAGYWGDYHVCDTPWHSIENAMQDIKARYPNIDRVYFTGDIVSHQVWATSRIGNSNVIKKFLQKLEDTFGSTVVYPILGNHEPHPVDLFPPLDIKEELSMQWLYDLIADEWARWLPKETKKTIRKGGYYTVLVKPGFRVIAINSNVCFTDNAWLVYDDRDPLEQLQWLADTLLEAEKNEEAVHILSHVPPGEVECSKQWSHEFKRIIERFHGIITGQYNGHTHYDEFKVFYDPKNEDRVINVANNGGSLTTFIAVNPNYKIYHIEEDQNRLLDFDLWTYDLPKANVNNTQPQWYKLYSFKDAFGIDNLNSDSYEKLLKKMSTDGSLLEKYQRFRIRNSSKQLNEHYEKKFLNDLLCDITSVEYTYPKICKHRLVSVAKKLDL